MCEWCCFRTEDVSFLWSLQASSLRSHDTISFLVNKTFLVQLTAVSVPEAPRAVCLVVQVLCPAGATFHPICRRQRMATMKWKWTVCRPARRRRWQLRPQTASLTWKTTRVFSVLRYRPTHLALYLVSLSCYSYCVLSVCHVPLADIVRFTNLLTYLLNSFTVTWYWPVCSAHTIN